MKKGIRKKMKTKKRREIRDPDCLHLYLLINECMTGLSFAKTFGCTEIEIAEARMQALSSEGSSRAGIEDEGEEGGEVAPSPAQ